MISAHCARCVFTGPVGITRRALLIGGALGLGAAGVAANSVPGRRLLGWTGPDGVVPATPEADVTDLGWGVVTSPKGVDRTTLPVCVLLHGRGANRHWWAEVGLPNFLSATAIPVVLVAVDGGDSYWTGSAGRMLTDQLPAHLAGERMRAPSAALGISMGGFGALALATRQPLRAVAAISPALFPTWAEADVVREVASRQEWEDNEPLRHVADLKPNTAIGVWCGREDPFHDPAVDYAAKARAEVTSFEHGLHDIGYWLRVLPEALHFIGDRLRG